MKVILDLCSGTGAWSKPYREAGYQVHEATLPGQDVRLLEFPGPVHGILAAPPCTVFARSGAWVKRTEQDWLEALSVVDACLRLVVVCRPRWWALENPVGMLKRYLGKPALYFHPCDYGDAWKKRTCLWGNFNPPKVNPVEPGESPIMKLGGNREKTKRLRAMTPPGFARAFFEANP